MKCVVSILVLALMTGSQAGYWSNWITDSQTQGYLSEVTAPVPGAYINKMCSMTGARVDNLEPYWSNGYTTIVGDRSGGGMNCGVTHPECFNSITLWISWGEVRAFRLGKASGGTSRVYGPAAGSTQTISGSSTECITGLRVSMAWWGGSTTDILRGISAYFETSADVCSSTGSGLKTPHACECKSTCATDAEYCNSLSYVATRLGVATPYAEQCPDSLNCCCSCKNCPVFVAGY